MQKCYTADFLTKRQVINQGELPQYYVEGDHEAIIPPETFELVQQELMRRNSMGKRYSGVDLFASRVLCGECDSCYGAKVWHSNSKYRRVIYQCNRKYQHDNACSTPHMTEDEIEAWFVQAINQLFKNKQEVITNLEGIRATLFDTVELESQRERLHSDLDMLQQAMHAAIEQNARVAQDQNAYQAHFDEMSRRYDETKAQHDAINKQIAEKTSAKSAAQHIIDTLRKQKELITEFDPSLWGSLVDHLTVFSKEDVCCTFKDGTEIKL